MLKAKSPSQKNLIQPKGNVDIVDKIEKVKELEKFDSDFNHFANMCNRNLNTVLDDVGGLLGLKNILKAHKSNLEEILSIDHGHRGARGLAFMYETLFKESLNLPENYLKVEPFNNIATTALIDYRDAIPLSLSTPVFSEKYNVECVGLGLTMYIDICNKLLQNLKSTRLPVDKIGFAVGLFKKSLAINTKENFDLYLKGKLDFKDDFTEKLLKGSNGISAYEEMKFSEKQIILVLKVIKNTIKEFDGFQDFLPQKV